jgi:hypothetical protein
VQAQTLCALGPGLGVVDDEHEAVVVAGRSMIAAGLV